MLKESNTSRTPLPRERATIRSAEAALEGRRPGLRGILPFPGPAFIAAVAYNVFLLFQTVF